MSKRRSPFVALLMAGVLVACSRTAQDSAPAASSSSTASVDNSHVNLTSLDPLRAAFNSDSGKVRAIFLASPT